MIKVSFINLSYLIICLIFNSLNAQTITERVNLLLNEEMKVQRIPGLQLVVIKNKSIILSVSKGLANVEFSVPVSENTLFSVNSITKVFTGTAIMQLVEQGKINLDSAIGDYLDSLPLNWREITLRQLCGNASGLPEISDNLTGHLLGEKVENALWESVKTRPLLSKPGEKFYYNSTNYVVLQKVIEKFGHCLFAQFLQRQQFGVIGIENIVFANSFDVVKNKSPTYTYYYQDENTTKHIMGNQLIQVYENFPNIVKADAGIFTSADDMAKWIIALLNNKLIKDDRNITTMWTPVKLTNGKTEGFGGILNGYAMGWLTINRVLHPGVAAVGGGRAGLIIYTKDNLAVILFTNLGSRSVESLIEKVANLYF